MDLDGKCCICYDDLNKKPTVNVVRGLENLINISIRRKDGRKKFFENVESLELHTDCRKKYTTISRGLLNYKIFSNQNSTANKDNELCPPKKKNLSLSRVPFDFEKNCFICGSEADIQKEKRKSLDKRKSRICKVTSKTFSENLLLRVSIKQDEQSNEILDRVACVDLLSKDARYHSNCYTKYLSACSREKSDHAKWNENQKIIDDYMDKVYKFIEDSQDSKFILTEIIKKIGRTDIDPCIETIRKRLAAKYGDSLNIQSKERGKTYLLFGDPEYMGLLNKWQTKNKDIESQELKLAKASAAMFKHKIRTLGCLDSYGNDNYTRIKEILKDADEPLSEILNVFVDELLVKNTNGD